MATGPIAPISAFPLDAGRVFPSVYTSQANSQSIETFAVKASVGTDSTWQFFFPLPDDDPSDTLTCRVFSVANASATQSAYIRLLWQPVAAASFDTAEGSLTDETESDIEIEHGVNLVDKFVTTDTALDATGLTFGTDKLLQVNLVAKQTSWDLGVVWHFVPTVLWT